MHHVRIGKSEGVVYSTSISFWIYGSKDKETRRRSRYDESSNAIYVTYIGIDLVVLFKEASEWQMCVPVGDVSSRQDHVPSR